MSDEIKIEKGIQIPRSKKDLKYPFRDMEVGDSFLAKTKRNNLAGSIGYASIKTGFKFKTRTVEGGIRVWRVA